MSSLHLEEATIKDIPILINIEQEVTSEKTYSAMVTEEEWLKELRENKVFLIKKEGALVGELAYQIRDDQEIYLSGIVILKQFRRQGIARGVLSDLLNKYPINNFSLVTHPNNHAIFLYQSLGFKILERTENYFGDGEPRLKLYLSREKSKDLLK